MNLAVFTRTYKPRAYGNMDKDAQIVIIALGVVIFWLLLGLYAFCRLRKPERKPDPNSLPRCLIRLPGVAISVGSPSTLLTYAYWDRTLAHTQPSPGSRARARLLSRTPSGALPASSDTPTCTSTYLVLLLV